MIIKVTVFFNLNSTESVKVFELPFSSYVLYMCYMIILIQYYLSMQSIYTIYIDIYTYIYIYIFIYICILYTYIYIYIYIYLYIYIYIYIYISNCV